MGLSQSLSLSVSARRGVSLLALIRALFRSGEPGVWLDPNDITTLFQDTAGTDPVTAPGQTVARINDKSGNGNNATQATAASRPAYGIMPEGGVRNFVLNNRFGGATLGVVGSGGVAPNNTSLPSPGSGLSIEIIQVGTEEDRPYIDLRWFGTASATTFFQLNCNVPNAPAASETTWTFSSGVRLIAGALPVGGLYPAGNQVRLGINEFNSSSAFVTGSATVIHTSVGPDRQRLAHTTTLSGTTVSIRGQVELRAELSAEPIDFTLRIDTCQLEQSATPSAVQITAANGRSVTEAGKRSVGYLFNDEVDDSLIATIPDLGTDATLFFATEDGVTISGGETIGAGSFEALRGKKTFAVGAINRALTATETANVTKYLNQAAGVDL